MQHFEGVDKGWKFPEMCYGKAMSISENPKAQADTPLVLIGLMGAGKTTVGRRLAKRLGRRFVDADEEIERAAGMSVADYFEQYGEPAFREGERRVIGRLLDEAEPIVLATGGGAYMDEETRATIQQKATSIWLKANLDLLVSRTSRRNTRPLLRNGNPREILKDLMDKRYPVYANSDVTVETGNVPHDAVVDLIVTALREKQDV